MATARTLETRVNFLFEEWNKLYLQYGEVVYAVAQIQKTKMFCFFIEQRGKRRSRYTGEEKLIVVQEALQSKLLCNLAGKGGVWL